MPERSFFLGNYQFPLCARCTGIALGHIAAIAAAPFYTFKYAVSLFMLPMAVDGTLQYFTSYRSNNLKRVIRALEYYRMHGEKISVHNAEERQKKSPYDFMYFVLTHERKVLYDRIEKRIDKMIEEGLISEVDNLLKKGYDSSLVSMQGLGYKEFIPYLKGECSLDEAVYILKRDTRHFAKRQLTWFRRERDVRWLDQSLVSSEEEILKEILNTINEEWSLLK